MKCLNHEFNKVQQMGNIYPLKDKLKNQLWNNLSNKIWYKLETEISKIYTGSEVRIHEVSKQFDIK
jgi:hypothetical protein